MPPVLGMEHSHLGPIFSKNFDRYGQNVFTGAVAKKYLLKAGVPLSEVQKVGRRGT